MKWKPEKSYRAIAVTAFLVIAASMLFYFLLFRTTTLGVAISKVISVFSPVIYGYVIAYVLNPSMVLLEKIFYRACIRMDWKPGKRFRKGFRIFCAFAALFGILVIVYALLSIVIPELINSIRSIILNFPVYRENVNTFIKEFFHNPELDENASAIMNNIVTNIQNYLNDFVPQLDKIAGSLTTGVVGFVNFIKNMILGIIISMYVLIAKEGLMARFRRFLYSVLNIERANRFLFSLRFADEKFGGFLIGKLIDSVIIGIICYISCMIMRMPYTTLIAVVIGATNVIPFFGPFLGAVPCTILIFVISPIKSLIFIIFILCLQQFDGNFLGPKILGNSVGVSSYMVVLSILVFGGFFGFTGMIIAVPICALLTALIQTFILRRAKEKKLPGDLESYHYVQQVNPNTLEFENSPADQRFGGLYERIRYRGEELRQFDNKIEERPWDRTYEQIEEEDALMRGESMKNSPDEGGTGAQESKAGEEQTDAGDKTNTGDNTNTGDKTDTKETDAGNKTGEE